MYAIRSYYEPQMDFRMPFARGNDVARMATVKLHGRVHTFLEKGLLKIC